MSSSVCHTGEERETQQLSSLNLYSSLHSFYEKSSYGDKKHKPEELKAEVIGSFADGDNPCVYSAWDIDDAS
jgi:hypothetical protein